MLVCLFGTARASIRAADTLLAALFCLIDIERGGCNDYHKNANYDIVRSSGSRSIQRILLLQILIRLQAQPHQNCGEHNYSDETGDKAGANESRW